jgi:hypothetical protein
LARRGESRYNSGVPVALDAILVGALCVLVSSCAPQGVCGETRSEIPGAWCTAPSDCPQTGQVVTCDFDTGNVRPCILCAAADGGMQDVRTRCFRVDPVPCP